LQVKNRGPLYRSLFFALHEKKLSKKEKHFNMPSILSKPALDPQGRKTYVSATGQAPKPNPSI
jgi:hypothetical protein